MVKIFSMILNGDDENGKFPVLILQLNQYAFFSPYSLSPFSWTSFSSLPQFPQELEKPAKRQNFVAPLIKRLELGETQPASCEIDWQVTGRATLLL